MKQNKAVSEQVEHSGVQSCLVATNGTRRCARASSNHGPYECNRSSWPALSRPPIDVAASMGVLPGFVRAVDAAIERWRFPKVMVNLRGNGVAARPPSVRAGRRRTVFFGFLIYFLVYFFRFLL